MPSHDLLVVLSECGRLSALSGGAFDVTVQPLWDVYAKHFFGTQTPAAGGTGPARRRGRAGAGELEGRRVQRQAGRAGARPVWALTLNGIAQGYVTDRIIGILRDNGFDRVLSDLGRSEIGVIGRHPDDRPWQVGLADPRQPEKFALVMDLLQGSRLHVRRLWNEVRSERQIPSSFRYCDGRQRGHYIATSVFAPSAMVADALSTALYVTPPRRGRELLAKYQGVTALVTLPDGAIQHLPG